MDIEAGDIGAMDAEAVRDRYAGAARAFLELAEQVPHHAWSRPALGEWDVRALTGHTSRALTTVETYLATPTTGERVAGPVEYFLAVRGATSPDAIAQRGKETGEALAGTRPQRCGSLSNASRPSSGTRRTMPWWPRPPGQ